MNVRFDAALVSIVALAALAGACGNNSSSATPTSPTLTTSDSGGTGSVPVPAPAPAAGAVSDPGGEWNLTSTGNVATSGCINASDISGGELDWMVTATPGHTHRLLMEGIVTRDVTAGCTPIVGGGTPRALTINGPWVFGAGEEGTRTIAWSTGQCLQDGGHFQIDIQVERDVPSEGSGDKESRELIVNCGDARR